MRLWTIQHPAVWDILRDRGVYRADGRRVWTFFRPAYRWMMRQMSRRLSAEHYHGRYPIWAWHTPKPDMREVGHYPPGELCVRLTLEIPDEEAPDRVLLSDFDGWGWHALNNWYFALSDEEYKWWDRLAPRRFEEELPEHLQEMVHCSWERIFDFAALEEAERFQGDPSTPHRVQATFEEIHLGEVVKAERFRARKDGKL